jgi:hypothetical protein
MSKGLKWFLSIIAGLAIVTVLVLAGFWVFNRWHEGGWMMGDRVYRFNDGWALPGRNVPGQGTPLNERPMQPVWGRPVSRLGGFHPLQALFLCLIGVGFIVLVVGAVVYLVRPQHPVAPSVAALPPAPAASPVSIQACSHCGRTVQVDWSHCPYCGSPLMDQTGSETSQT